MPDFNKVILAGRLTNNPEIRNTPTGTPFTRFPIAVSRYWKGANEQPRKETNFFNITAWNNAALNCGKYLTKGKSILVEGRLRIQSYEGKDGIKRYSTEIVSEKITFLEKKEAERSSANDIPSADGGDTTSGGVPNGWAPNSSGWHASSGISDDFEGETHEDQSDGQPIEDHISNKKQAKARK